MKNLLKIAFAIIFLSLSSCKITKALWMNAYTDQIRQFLVSQDGTHVVFLSPKHHYIMDDSARILKEILFSRYRYLLTLDTRASSIRLFQDNNIEATLVIKLNTLQPPLDAARYFQSLGFQDSPTHEFFIKVGLVGTRYKASRDLQLYTQSLNRTYNVEITEDMASFANASKIALTPITLTADAVLTLGTIVLWPFISN